MRVTWDYIAGFFDGEGSLSTMNFTWRDTLASTIATMSQSGDEGFVVLSAIRDFLWERDIKGYIQMQKRTKQYRIMHHLKICARPSVERFLQQMLPRVSVKRVVVQDTLRFITAFPSVKGATTANRNRSRGKYGSANLDPVVLASDRATGMKFTAIARKYGVNYYTVKKYLDPEYRKKYDAYRNKWRQNQIDQSKAARQDAVA